MADRSYASIRIGGRLDTAAAAERLVDALVKEGLVPSDSACKALLLGAISAGTTLVLEDSEVVGGTFGAIDDAVAEFKGLTCTTMFDGHYEWSDGFTTITEDGEALEFDRSGDMPTIRLDVIEKAFGSSASMIELIGRAKRSTGEHMPPLTCSNKVRSWLAAEEDCPTPNPPIVVSIYPTAQERDGFRQGQHVRILEATMGASITDDDGEELTFEAGAKGVIDRIENYGNDQGWVFTVTIEDQIINCWDERDGPIANFLEAR